jgi:hypothetical protein
MLHKASELWLALLAILFITLVYLFVMVVGAGIPAASSLFGHGIGIVGFLLMVMTETLYTLRKRSRSARWGSMATWLQFHIFTGLVGPYMVLLHTSWRFNGVAGVLMLLTVLVVASGFVGRYIYTAIPRTADGAELLETEIERLMIRLEHSLAEQLETLPADLSPFGRRLALAEEPAAGGAFALRRVVSGWRERRELWALRRHLDPAQRAQIERLQDLLHEHHTLRRERASLVAMRRLLAIWHAVHIPIGLGLFSLALVHIVAAVYYADLLH